MLAGVIIEGAACAGKSTLLRGLLRHPAFAERPGMSSVILTEHHTLRVLEPRRGRLAARDNVELLSSHVDYLAGLVARLAGMPHWEGRPNPRLAVVFERFHLSHVASCDHLRWEDVSAVDGRLAELGVRICLVVASPAELRRRLRDDRGAGWASFLGEAGVRDRVSEGGDEARIEYFVRQQDALRALAARSRLAVTELDSSALTREAATEALLALITRGSPVRVP
jgi:hypothetical protein